MPLNFSFSASGKRVQSERASNPKMVNYSPEGGGKIRRWYWKQCNWNEKRKKKEEEEEFRHLLPLGVCGLGVCHACTMTEKMSKKRAPKEKYFCFNGNVLEVKR